MGFNLRPFLQWSFHVQNGGLHSPFATVILTNHAWVTKMKFWWQVVNWQSSPSLARMPLWSSKCRLAAHWFDESFSRCFVSIEPVFFLFWFQYQSNYLSESPREHCQRRFPPISNLNPKTHLSIHEFILRGGWITLLVMARLKPQSRTSQKQNWEWTPAFDITGTRQYLRVSGLLIFHSSGIHQPMYQILILQH